MTAILHEEIYKILKESFSLERIDTGSYALIKYPRFLPSMKFQTERYHAEGFGNVFFMSGKGLGGKLSLLTLCLSPLDKVSLPVALLNVMDLGGNKIVVTLEYLDTGVGSPKELKKIKEKNTKIPDYMEEKHWYREYRLPGSFSKVCTKMGREPLASLTLDSLKAYLSSLSQGGPDTFLAKSRLRERILEEGSMIPETIEKALGKERYATLLEKVLLP